MSETPNGSGRESYFPIESQELALEWVLDASDPACRRPLTPEEKERRRLERQNLIGLGAIRPPVAIAERDAGGKPRQIPEEEFVLLDDSLLQRLRGLTRPLALVDEAGVLRGYVVLAPKPQPRAVRVPGDGPKPAS